MAIYLSRKKGGTVATPITPSNSNPAQMTANVAVNPTGNGYAIQSYDSVTPSGTPTSVSSGDIVKIGGSGVIVDSIPTPTNLTPSNSSPATITSGEIYRATRGGEAVEWVESLTPSDSNPARIRGGYIYNPGNNFGYAIESEPATKTPSDSSPASVSSGAIIKASSSGYLYATIQPKVKTGTATLSANTNNTINCGFEPKYIAYSVGTSGNVSTYNSDISTTQFKKCGSSGITNTNIGTSASYNLMEITSTGFSVRGSSSSISMNYFAIG